MTRTRTLTAALTAVLSFGLLSVVHSARAQTPATQPATQPAAVITVDASEAPELADLAARVKGVADEWYPKIVAALPGKDFRPARKITITFDKDYDGVAYASGNRIVASVKFFTAHPDDLGAFVHELVHVVQAYRGGERPGWLVEGIADHVRFFQYEPVEKRPTPNPQRAKHTDSYRTSAAFLDWAQRTYDPQLVIKLNEACRTAKYSPELWEQYTGKSLDVLGEEWRASLPTPATRGASTPRSTVRG
jgi:hypothetical protein